MQRIINLHTIVLISILLLGIVTNNYAIFSFVLLGYLLYYFFKNLGQKVLLLEIIAILTMVQWVVVPFLFFDFVGHDDYNSQINIKSYLPFAFIGTSLFIIGFSIPLFRFRIDYRLLFSELSYRIKNKKIKCLLLITLGILANSAGPLLSDGFTFVFTMLSYMVYIGLFLAIFCEPRFRLFIFFVVFIYTISFVANQGMFNSLVYWGMFFVIYLSLKIRKASILLKTFVFLIGFAIILLIQSIKFEYRAVSWKNDRKEADIELLGELVSNRITNPETLFNKQNYVLLLRRLNQGLFIAKTMQHVPRFEPYAEGETINKAILGAIVPRVIWPSKPKAGGDELFTRFTGWRLEGTTSMNISALGEGYVNYGYYGAFVFIFCFGLFFNLFFKLCLMICKTYPAMILWLPFLFKNSIFVGTDVFTILNGMVKSALFLFLFYWFWRICFKVRF